MKKEILKNNDNLIEARCLFDEKETNKTRNAILKQLRKDVFIPGFRAGKVPDKILIMKFKDKILEDAQMSLFQDASSELKKEGFFYNVKPEFNFDVNDKEYAFTLEYIFIPKFELPDYSEYKVTTEVEPVSDEEIEKEIRNYMKKDGVYKEDESGKALELEDQAILSVAFYKDADKKEPIDTKKTDYEVFLYENKENKEFLAELIGKKKGDSGSYTIVNNDYFKRVFSLENEETYTIDYTVKTIKSLELPELNDAYVQSSVDGYDSVEGMRNAIKDMLLGRKQEELKAKQEEELMERLLKDSTIEITDAAKAALVIKENMEDGEVVKETPGEEEQAKIIRNIQEECIIESIGEEEGVTVTQEEIEEERQRFLGQFGAEIAPLMAQRTNDMMFMQAILRGKVFGILRNIALSNV